jgi:hypothetical protein
MRIDRSGSGCALPVRSAMFGVLAAALSVSLAAQTPQPQAPPAGAPAPAELPSARAIIDRHIVAIGGRAAILRHSSLRSVGTITISGAGITGGLEILAAKPNFSLMRVTLGGIGEVVEGFNGTTAWGVSGMTGPMIYQGKELEQKRFDAEFYGELADPSRYISMTTLERATFNDRPAFKVRLLRRDGTESFEFYDVETGLKSGGTTTRETPMGQASVTTIMTDYKKFGDLLHPTLIKSTTMGVEQVYTITLVEYDTVTTSMFELPEQIKALAR